MEHLRLLLHMVLSMARTQAAADATATAAMVDEWQEDSGLGLYRAPEEGAAAGACAATSIHSVSLEKKVSLLVGSPGLGLHFGSASFEVRCGRVL